MKNLKIILIVVGIIVGIILLDTLQALVFNNNPIIGINTKCMSRQGIFVYTYHCSNGENITKLKKSNVCYYSDVCGKDETVSNWSKDNVIMTVKDISEDRTGGILVIEDKNDTPTYWNTYYSIQRLSEADVWYDLKAKTSMEQLMGVSVPNDDGITEIELNWKDLYGELSSGTYRIIKKKDFVTLYSETFEI